MKLQNKTRIQYITSRYEHHTSHSGYDRLAQYGDNIISAKPFSRTLIRNRIMWKLANGVISYDRESLALEMAASWRILKEQDCVFHILYGESIYHYIGILNGIRNNHLVATFHQPLSVFQRQVRIDWHLKQLSAVICVGTNQVEYFSNILGGEKAYFIPHGVDIEYFSPPETFMNRTPDLCLFVGNWLRDFPTLRGVVELVSFQRPETRFIAVTHPQNLSLLGVHPKLSILSNISDEELLSLYRMATILVLPCLDATANNAILEAMACGLPIVTTDIGGIRDYLDDDSAVLVPLQDSFRMANAVISLLDDIDTRHALSKKVREKALEFSWPIIFEKMQNVYQRLG